MKDDFPKSAMWPLVFLECLWPDYLARDNRARCPVTQEDTDGGHSGGHLAQSGQRYYSTLVTGSCWEGPSWGHLESWCLSCPGNSEWGWPPMTGSRVSSCQNTSPPTIAGLTFISRDVLSVDPQLLQIVLDSPAKRDTVGSVLWEVHVVLHYDVGHLPFRPAIGQTRTKNVVSETLLKTQDEIHSWCQFLSILKNWEA